MVACLLCHFLCLHLQRHLLLYHLSLPTFVRIFHSQRETLGIPSELTIRDGLHHLFVEEVGEYTRHRFHISRCHSNLFHAFESNISVNTHIQSNEWSGGE